MPLETANWNVVVIGSWNRAILTPSGIGKRIFELDEGTPLEVQVPLGILAPPRIKHGETVVIAGDDRLVVQTMTRDFQHLGQAMAAAKRAVKSLPETPISAVGINVRYSSSDSEESLMDLATHQSDSRLTDLGFKIVARTNRRKVQWKDGVINISIDTAVEEDGSSGFEVLFNFHRDTTVCEAVEQWLSTPPDELECQCRKLLDDYLCVSLEEASDE